VAVGGGAGHGEGSSMGHGGVAQGGVARVPRGGPERRGRGGRAGDEGEGGHVGEEGGGGASEGCGRAEWWREEAAARKEAAAAQDCEWISRGAARRALVDAAGFAPPLALAGWPCRPASLPQADIMTVPPELIGLK
jgi:hypothetical protein